MVIWLRFVILTHYDLVVCLWSRFTSSTKQQPFLGPKIILPNVYLPIMTSFPGKYTGEKEPTDDNYSLRAYISQLSFWMMHWVPWICSTKTWKFSYHHLSLLCHTAENFSNVHSLIPKSQVTKQGYQQPSYQIVFGKCPD